MLIISDTQMAVLAQAQWQTVLTLLQPSLREAYVAELADLSEQEQELCVLWALQQGRALGLRQADALQRLAECLLEFGPALLRHPLWQCLLRPTPGTAGLSPEARLYRAIEGMPLRVWDELSMLDAWADWLQVLDEVAPAELDQPDEPDEPDSGRVGEGGHHA